MTKSLLVFALSILLVSQAYAQDDWSFADHPQPVYEDQTPAERKVLEEAEREAASDEDGCRLFVDAYYRIYKLRYPDFGDWNTEEVRFLRWENHMIHGPPYLANGCLALKTALAIRDIDRNLDGFFYCGRFSRSHWTRREEKIGKLVQEIIAYASSGIYSAISSLIMINDLSPAVDLAPAVEYYFRKLKDPDHPELFDPRDVSHLVPLLDAKTRIVIEDAAKRRDLDIVLEMVEECGERKKQ